MRALIAALALLLLPACSIQGQAALGTPLYPMLMVNEADLQPGAYTDAGYPEAPWDDAQACLEEMGYVVPEMERPELWVVPPPVNSFRVAEVLRDSLGVYGTGFSAPTYGYALSHSHAVLILDRDKDSFRTLRHEAIHIMLWEAAEMYGHPQAEFDTCDRDRPVPAAIVMR